MLLGLIRHFKVDIARRKFFSSPDDFRETMECYDSAPVIHSYVQNSFEWDICYCSSLPRAVTTAKDIYKGEILITDLLREVPIHPFIDKKILLPTFLWHIGARIAWFRKHKSQTETIQDTLERADKFYNIIKESGKDKILIVSHGYFMKVFTEVLRKKGVEGEMDMHPKNGKLYLYKLK